MKNSNMQYLRDFSYYNISPWFIAISSLLLLPIFTKYLTPEDYGMRAIVILVIFFVQVPATLGINWVLRAKFFDLNNSEKKKYITSLAVISFLPRILICLLIFFMIENNYLPYVFDSWELEFNELLYIQLAIFLITSPMELKGTYI